MKWEFERAENGNVALTGEFDLESSNGTSFIVALGFGRNAEEAGQRARASIFESFETAKTQFIDVWAEWLKKQIEIKTSKMNAPKYLKVRASMLCVHDSI